jgi:hypothetical protein
VIHLTKSLVFLALSTTIGTRRSSIGLVLLGKRWHLM